VLRRPRLPVRQAHRRHWRAGGGDLVLLVAASFFSYLHGRVRSR
jgi:hypothetical protein